MVMLVHIAPENRVKRILRSGIAPARGRVWAFPVLASYTLTHSWSRELKRSGATTLASITFRVPDDEIVLARHYREEPREMTAAEAVGTILRQADPRGYEIMVPRRIQPSEIVRARTLPKAIGWRYYPEAKGQRPWACDCDFCQPKGAVNAKRDRARVAERIRLLDAARKP